MDIVVVIIKGSDIGLADCFEPCKVNDRINCKIFKNLVEEAEISDIPLNESKAVPADGKQPVNDCEMAVAKIVQKQNFVTSLVQSQGSM